MPRTKPQDPSPMRPSRRGPNRTSAPRACEWSGSSHCSSLRGAASCRIWVRPSGTALTDRRRGPGTWPTGSSRWRPPPRLCSPVSRWCQPVGGRRAGSAAMSLAGAGLLALAAGGWFIVGPTAWPVLENTHPYFVGGTPFRRAGVRARVLARHRGHRGGRWGLRAGLVDATPAPPRSRGLGRSGTTTRSAPPPRAADADHRQPRLRGPAERHDSGARLSAPLSCRQCVVVG